MTYPLYKRYIIRFFVFKSRFIIYNGFVRFLTLKNALGIYRYKYDETKELYKKRIRGSGFKGDFKVFSIIENENG